MDDGGGSLHLWFTEYEYAHRNCGYTVRVRAALHAEETPFQSLRVLDTYHYGRMLVLDGLCQTTELDEFCYHEMLVHPALLRHPAPARVLIVGGGDGGAAREVLRHRSVSQVDLVEIDEKVILASKQWFPNLAVAFSDPRLNVQIADGIKFVAEAPAGTYDAVIVDSSDPIGPATGLFTAEFYRQCRRVLKTPGLLIAQTGSLWYQPEESRQARERMRAAPLDATVYWGLTPSYPAGVMAYTLGATGLDVLDFARVRAAPEDWPLKYYTRAVDRGAFALPAFARPPLDARPACSKRASGSATEVE